LVHFKPVPTDVAELENEQEGLLNQWRGKGIVGRLGEVGTREERRWQTMKRSTKLACLTLVMGVVMAWTATSAQALTWVVNDKNLPLDEDHPVTCEEVGPLDLEGEDFGTDLDFRFHRADCDEWEIWNTEVEMKPEALSLGTLELSEGEVVGFDTCELEDAVSEPITGRAALYPELGTKTGVTYWPRFEDLITLDVVAEKGEACLIEGEYPVEGAVVAEVPEVDKFLPNPLPYDFDAEVEEITGDHLSIFEEPFSLEGNIDFDF
jgi:hypothetical protein